MQFVFGSDNSNGYGLLYADNASDAERARAQLTFPIRANEIDCCGFMGFGPNSNRPLFFKCSKDIGYAREAYYIHGVYRDADENYYNNIGTFLKDLFVTFIDSKWTNGAREGMAEAPACIFDAALSTRFSSKECVIGNATCANIIARVLSGEKFILSVPDDIFSNDFARLAMCYIYMRLPNDVIKSCSYISNVPEAENIRIRVLPESVARTCKGTIIPICDREYQPTPVADYNEIAENILNIYTSEEYKDFLRSYRKICNTYSSNYKPSKFLLFWNAYIKKDKNAARQLLEDYLADTPNPNPQDIPAFAVNLLRGNIPTNLQLANFEQLLHADEILEANTNQLRELYAVDAGGAFVQAIQQLYNPNGVCVFQTEPMNTQRKNSINEKLQRYKSINRNEMYEYHREFYKVTDGIFAVLETRINNCNLLLEKCLEAQKGVDNGLNQQAKYFNKQEWAAWHDKIIAHYNKVCGEDAARLCFDISDVTERLAQDSLAKHNKVFLPSIGDTDASVEEIEGNTKYYNEFMQCAANGCALNEFIGRYDNVQRFYGPASQKTKECTVQFLKKSESYGREGVADLLAAFSKYKGVDTTIVELAQSDLSLALSSAARYRNFDDGVNCIIAILNRNAAAFDALDKDELSKLTHRVVDLNLVKMNGGSRFTTEAEFKKYVNAELAALNGNNASKFKKQLLTVWSTDPVAAYNKRNAGKKSKGSSGVPQYEEDGKNRLLPIIIAVLIGVLIVGAVVFALIYFDIIGGKDNDSTTSDVTSEISSETKDDTTVNADGTTNDGTTSVVPAVSEDKNDSDVDDSKPADDSKPESEPDDDSKPESKPDDDSSNQTSESANEITEDESSKSSGFIA